jgi:hypothetical protein
LDDVCFCVPPEIIATLNQNTNAAVLDPNIKQQFAALGAVAVPPNSPDEFAKFVAENIDKWTKVIRFRASSRSGLGHVPTFHNVSWRADVKHSLTRAVRPHRHRQLATLSFPKIQSSEIPVRSGRRPAAISRLSEAKIASETEFGLKTGERPGGSVPMP